MIKQLNKYQYFQTDDIHFVEQDKLIIHSYEKVQIKKGIFLNIIAILLWPFYCRFLAKMGAQPLHSLHLSLYTDC